jgi:glutamine synthetase
MTPEEILQLCQDEEVAMVDFKFCDFLGTLQHFTIPVSQLNAEVFEEGLGFDGSSIRGWQAIQESDMLVMPDPATASLDPFHEHPTLSLVCNILDPITRAKYSRDPRNVALKAEAYLQTTGLADTAYFGPELEFFLFDDVRYTNSNREASYSVDSEEGIWNSGEKREGGNLGYRIRHKEGYIPAPPFDKLQDIRSEMTTLMERAGLEIETHHHEVATAGQCEIDMRFDSLLRMADKSCLYKYIVKQVARQHGLVANFMPKPLFGDNGSGMHTHFSIWKGGKNLMAGNGYAGMSEIRAALHRRHLETRARRCSRSRTRRPTAIAAWCRVTRRP